MMGLMARTDDVTDDRVVVCVNEFIFLCACCCFNNLLNHLSKNK